MTQEPSSSPLTAATAADYSLSIRPASGGLAFCVQRRGSAPELVEQGFLASRRPEARLYEQLEELYYQSELLSYPYGEVVLYVEPQHWCLVPTELFRPGSEALWLDAATEPTATGGAEQRQQLLSWTQPDSVQTFVFAWDAEAYHFLRRTLLLLEPRPYFALPLSAHRQLSRASRSPEVLLLLRAGQLELFLLREGELLSCGHYPLVGMQEARVVAEEAAFYLISYWRHHGLEGQTAGLTIGYPEEGDAATCHLLHEAADLLAGILRPHIGQLQLEAYRSTSLAPL